MCFGVGLYRVCGESLERHDAPAADDDTLQQEGVSAKRSHRIFFLNDNVTHIEAHSIDRARK